MLRHHIQLLSMHAGEAGTGSVSFPHVQVFRTNLEACSQKVLGNRGGTRKYVAKSNVHPGEIHAAAEFETVSAAVPLNNILPSHASPASGRVGSFAAACRPALVSVGIDYKRFRIVLETTVSHRQKICFLCTQIPESRTSSLDALLRI